MSDKSNFIAGYNYGWGNRSAWYGNTQASTQSDDLIDAGILAAHRDEQDNRPRDPEAAWSVYSEEQPKRALAG